MNRIRAHVIYPTTKPVKPPKPRVLSEEYLYTFSRWRIPEEDARLKHLWGQFSIQEIADMMGRSRRTISDRAARLKLCRGNVPHV